MPADDTSTALGPPEVVALVVAIGAAVVLVTFPFGRDQGIFAAVGAAIIDGGLPYRDAWDFKPPGIHLLYAAGQALVGRSPTGLRALEGALLLVGVFGVRRLGLALGLSRWGSTLSVVISALLYIQLGFWHTAQPENVGGWLVVAGLLAGTRPGLGRLVVCGACFGLAFLLKPPLAAGALVCALAGERPVFRALAIGLAASVPIALCVGWLVAGGAWPDVIWTFGTYLPGYTALGWADASLVDLVVGVLRGCTVDRGPALPAGLLASVVLVRRLPPRLWLPAATAALMVLGAVLQAKIFAYHLAGALPLLALIAAAGLAATVAVAARVHRALQALALVVIVVLLAVSPRDSDQPLDFWTRTAEGLAAWQGKNALAEHHLSVGGRSWEWSAFDVELAARAVGARTSADESVLVFGFEPYVCWRAMRRPASRFIYDAPQRSAWVADSAVDRLLGDLERRPPALVLVQRGDVLPHVVGNEQDSAAALARLPAVRAVLEADFVEVSPLAGFDVWERR